MVNNTVCSKQPPVTAVRWRKPSPRSCPTAVLRLCWGHKNTGSLFASLVRDAAISLRIATRRTATHWCGPMRSGVAIVAVTACCAMASADEIKLGGFWIGDVSIQGVEDAQVVYFNRVGTEFTRPIQAVQGLKLSAYPQLEDAYEALDNKDDLAALQALEDVRGKTGSPWLQQWVSHLLVAVYNRLNMPSEAVDRFLWLARDGAIPFYLSDPPLTSLAQTSPEVQHTLHQRITIAMEDLVGQPATMVIKQLLEPLEARQADDHSGQPPDSGQAGGTLVGDVGRTPGQEPEKPVAPQGKTNLVLSRFLDVGDAVTQMLVHGQFDQALAQANQLLQQGKHDLPMRMYQKGIAQLYLAQASGDNKQYHDAGLSFMSVLAYFPDSNYAGSSLVEAAVVHSKIGRRDIAKKLYERASFVLDTQEDPRYADRLEQLTDRLNP